MSDLSHTDESGRARMVDVGDKRVTRRRAIARARVFMNEAAYAAMRSNTAAKGDVLAVAKVAGIAAAKRCAELIPLCHLLPLDQVELRFGPDDAAKSLSIDCEVHCEGKTGVEMEAMVGASVAALTVYDMLKAVDRAMRIGDVALLEKSGGASGDWRRG